MDAQARPNMPEYASKLIRHKTKQLIGRFGFTRSDRPDLAQELGAHLVERLPKYDPRRSSQNTFVSRVIERKIASIIRHQKAGLRDHRRVGRSLAELSPDEFGKPTELGDAADARVERRSGPREINRADLSIDLRSTVDSLDPTARRICEQLSDETITGISRQLGLSRATVYEHIARIRRQFHDAGLAEYMDE